MPRSTSATSSPRAREGRCRPSGTSQISVTTKDTAPATLSRRLLQLVLSCVVLGAGVACLLDAGRPEWLEFRELDWAGSVKDRMRNPLVVDGRNFLDDEALRAAGFTYEGIGRHVPVAHI